SSKGVPTQRQYFEQEQAVARRYLAGGATLDASARRLAEIASAMLGDDEAWAELERRDDGPRPPRSSRRAPLVGRPSSRRVGTGPSARSGASGQSHDRAPQTGRPNKSLKLPGAHK